MVETNIFLKGVIRQFFSEILLLLSFGRVKEEWELEGQVLMRKDSQPPYDATTRSEILEETLTAAFPVVPTVG